MKTNHQRIPDRNPLAGFRVVRFATLIAAGLWISPTQAREPMDTGPDDKIIVESGEATPVTEKVRAAAPGTLVAILVKPGDNVKKDQILGHTELAATKYQLDLARHALENIAPLTAAEGQAEAWTATRVETEEAVRRRKVEKIRLDWAAGMEKFHRANHQAQLEQKKLQRIQYEYWQEQYEARFLRAPVDGVVTEVLSEPGKPVGYAAHVFTVSNEASYMIPVSVPAKLVQWVIANSMLPIRSSRSRFVTRGRVDSIIDDPSSPGRKIVRLLVSEADLPRGPDANPTGMTFDVLLPQDAARAG
ncbi:MAG: HlyD family efflux transporter periplasmic adaptor subunit [Akkermansiaceae bacterium]|jgi:multidrug efflux pump subunit AcrA (membrane-fusion protein)|nr:HlyD family efflux transporter periplasmic adaptor subunit [Akkermansiaceae bacterium]